MNETTLGEIIAKIRNKRGYSRKKVCDGLCSTQMLAKIENDEVDTDKLLLDQIIQRLGKSTDNLEVILSDEEYSRITARENLEQCIWKNDQKQYELCMQQYIKNMPKNNAQVMFVKRTEAYKAFRMEQDYEKAEVILREAIELTLPGIIYENRNKHLLSKTEIENILALCRLLLKKNDTEQAKLWLEKVKHYIDTMISDGIDQAQLNSKASWLLAQIYMNNEDYLHAYDLCESAINGLRKYVVLHFMLPLLEQIIICCTQLEIDAYKKKWKDYYDMLKSMYEEYGDSYYCHDSIFHNVYRMTYYLAGELIQNERTNRKLTQEKLIEGVYELPENLSRLEHGKATPTKRNLEKLLENLEGVKRRKYEGDIVVDSFELIEKMTEIDFLIGKGLFEQANEGIREMQEEIDCNQKRNQITVETYDTMIKMKSGVISEEEARETFVKILRKSYWQQNNTFFRVPCHVELLSLNALSILLKRKGDEEESTKLLQSIIEVAENSKLANRHMSSIFSVTYANINQRLPKEENCRQGIAFELLCGNGSLLYIHMYVLGKCMQEQNEKREILRKALIMGELFLRREDNKQVIKDYYEESFGEELKL